MSSILNSWMPVSAIMFDLDETLFNRSESLRTFVENQFIHMELGNFENLQALSNRFLELDRPGAGVKARGLRKAFGRNRAGGRSDLDTVVR